MGKQRATQVAVTAWRSRTPLLAVSGGLLAGAAIFLLFANLGSLRTWLPDVSAGRREPSSPVRHVNLPRRVAPAGAPARAAQPPVGTSSAPVRATAAATAPAAPGARTAPHVVASSPAAATQPAATPVATQPRSGVTPSVPVLPATGPPAQTGLGAVTDAAQNLLDGAAKTADPATPRFTGAPRSAPAPVPTLTAPVASLN